jgi:hypothetical protein
MSQPNRKRAARPGKSGKNAIGGVDFSKDYICLVCGCQRVPVMVRRGHVIIEILLWLCYLLPGVVYTLWRTLRRHEVCPNCRNPSMVKTTSPQAFHLRKLMTTLSQPRDKTTGEA